MDAQYSGQSEDVAAGEVVLVVSPHLDDALLSAHELVRRRSAEVWTVFAGDPERPVTTEWDLECGYPDSRALMVQRRAEDAAACATVGARYRHLGGLDSVYTDPARRAGDLEALRRDLSDWVGSQAGRQVTVVLPVGAGVVLPPSVIDFLRSRFSRFLKRAVVASASAVGGSAVPVDPERGGSPEGGHAAPAGRARAAAVRVRAGLGRLARTAERLEYRGRRLLVGEQAVERHRDHLAVRDAALAVLAGAPAVRIVLFEDFPYLLSKPGDAEAARIARRRGRVAREQEFAVDRELKWASVSRYSSQLAVLVPGERLSGPDAFPAVERTWVLDPVLA